MQLIFLILLCSTVMGSLQINKVLYDPLNTEAGGEALEIINTGNSSFDLEGVVIATSSSQTDANLPKFVLLPNQKYLIADENWNTSRDVSSWRDADYCEKITLGNSKGGVAIVKDEVVLDVLGWGDEEELFSVKTANKTATGLCLIRVRNTGDNSKDFVQSNCSFVDGESLFLVAEVNPSFSAWISNQDSPYNVHAGERIVVEATSSCNASFAGKEYNLKVINNSYIASIDTSGVSAGAYTLHVGSVQFDVNILPTSMILVSKRQLSLDPSDSVVIKNQGSVVSTVTLSVSDLKRNSDTISKDYIKINGVSLSTPQKFSIAPGDNLKIDLELTEVHNAPPGLYESVFRIIYDS